MRRIASSTFVIHMHLCGTLLPHYCISTRWLYLKHCARSRQLHENAKRYSHMSYYYIPGPLWCDVGTASDHVAVPYTAAPVLLSGAELKDQTPTPLLSLNILRCTCHYTQNAFLRLTYRHQLCYANHDFPIRHRHTHRLLPLQRECDSRAKGRSSTCILKLVRAAPGSHLRHAERRKATEHATQFDQR